MNDVESRHRRTAIFHALRDLAAELRELEQTVETFTADDGDGPSLGTWARVDVEGARALIGAAETLAFHAAVVVDHLAIEQRDYLHEDEDDDGA